MPSPITFLDEQAFHDLIASPTPTLLSSPADKPVQHVLRFTTPPSNEELRSAVAKAVTKPFPISGYRFIAEQTDKLAYLIEEVDVAADLEAKRLRDGYHVCHISITCSHCNTVYKGWRKLPKKDWTAGPYHESIAYCPNCPPISIDVWKRQFADLLETRPEPFIEPLRSQVTRQVREVTLSAAEMEEFD